MTIEVSIIMLSVNLVAYGRMKRSRKVALVACFVPRILVIAASLARLIFLYPITPHDNPEFNLWIPVICTEIQVCLAISTACIPSMKPLLDGTEGNGSKRVSRAKKHNRSKEWLSMDSTGLTSPMLGRTNDFSPRLPSPRPLSPLTPPRLVTPPNTSASNSRTPSEHGLKLHIPPPEIRVREASAITSPQTASSHALSPPCLSQ